MNTKLIVLFIAMIAGVYLAGFFGPWWAPAAFIVLLSVLMQLTIKRAMMAGMVSLGLVFLLMASWMNHKDDAAIIEKTGALLGGLSSIALILVTTLIGAITGLFAGWVGGAIAQMYRSAEKK